MTEEPIIEIARTGIFRDPHHKSRFIRGVIYRGKKSDIPKEMQVWCYHKQADAEPYWTQHFGLNGFDSKAVPYYRRPLFHGLVKKLMQKCE